jgi:hypothetical protein
MQTVYRVIGFGTSEHGFFNEKSFSSTLGYALGMFNAHKEDPEMDGAVIIKSEHETWEVIEEFGTEGMSIVCGPLFSFKVEKAPELVMV